MPLDATAERVGLEELQLLCANARAMEQIASSVVRICDRFGLEDDLLEDSTFDADELGLTEDL